jgi:hypothetical protein
MLDEAVFCLPATISDISLGDMENFSRMPGMLLSSNGFSPRIILLPASWCSIFVLVKKKSSKLWLKGRCPISCRRAEILSVSASSSPIFSEN